MKSVLRILEGVAPSALALALLLGGCATTKSELPPFEDEEVDAGAEQAKRDGGTSRDAAPSNSSSQTDSGTGLNAQPDSGASQPDAFVQRDAAPDAAPATPDAMVVAGCTQLPATGAIMMNGATTAASPTWARPLATTCPATGTSTIGTAVPRELHVFCNDTGTARTYEIQMDGLDEAATLTHPDPYLVLYDGPMLPANALTCAVGNDDRGTISAGAGLERLIPAGGRVTVVATGFENADLGTYTLRVTAK